MARVATAAVLAPVFIYISWFAPVTAFIAVMEIVGAVCFLEYAGMAKNRGIAVFRARGMVAALLLPVAFLSTTSMAVYIVAALIAGSMMLSALAGKESGVESLAYTVFGILYIGLSFSAPVLLRIQPEGERLLLLICCATWGADIGAYYVGKIAGKTKLAPSISPGKTVEGFIGGVVSALLLGWLFSHFFFRDADPSLIGGAGIIGGMLGPVGDLTESKLKRHFGVKDSGKILPGHGGFLDRADALMLTAPLFYVFLALIGALA